MRTARKAQAEVGRGLRLSEAGEPPDTKQFIIEEGHVFVNQQHPVWVSLGGFYVLKSNQQTPQKEIFIQVFLWKSAEGIISSEWLKSMDLTPLRS